MKIVGLYKWCPDKKKEEKWSSKQLAFVREKYINDRRPLKTINHQMIIIR